MEYPKIQNSAGHMSRLSLFSMVLIIILGLCVQAETAVLYVDITNNSGTKNGSSWATAYSSIQDAVDAASSGDEIWVAAGTYTGTGDYVVEMAEDVDLYGGFAGTETQQEQPNWISNPTTIDGADTRRGLLGAHGSRLDGFTVTRGGNFMDGGGMYVGGELLNEVFMSIVNCTFVNNYTINGGAIYNLYGDIELINCTFTQNGALQGGAVYNINSYSTITGCTFNENLSSNYGGAIYNVSTYAEISDCYFIGNSVGYINASKGGGLYSKYSRETITNCVFRDNETDGFGGGFYSLGSYGATIVNCSFSGNQAGDQGGGIWTDGSPVIKNSILWGNSADNNGNEIYDEYSAADISYSCLNGIFPGTGNLNTNPDFVSQTDLRLQAGSPCIDSGTSTESPTTDIVGQARPIGNGWDMGAYEMPETIDDDILEDQDRIIFPAGFTSLDTLLGNSWVGATAMNINSSAKGITFLGKDSSGSTLSTNSSLPDLKARGQLANLTTEIVTMSSRLKTIIGEGDGNSDPLRGIFVLGDSATSRLDGIGHRWITGKELYLLNGWEKSGEATIVFLYNPSLSEQADVVLAWTAPDGSVIDTENLSISSEGTLFEPFSDLFTNPGTQEGYLKITSSAEVCGFLVNATSQAFIAFPAQPAAEAEALYASHFILLPDGSGTELQLVNAGNYAASVVFTATDDTQRAFTSQGLILEPGQMRKGGITEFMPLNPGELGPNELLTGRIQVDIASTGPAGVNPRVLGGITLNGSPTNSAALPLETEGWEETVFPHIAQSLDLRIFTGLAIWNITGNYTNVTVRSWNQDGQITATKSFSLAPGLRRVGLLNEDFYFGSQYSQVGGHLEIISSREVISFCLYGDFDLVYLSTIGGQEVE
jgi:predicted outer membrane repeat protein